MSWQTTVKQREYKVVQNGTEFENISQQSEVRRITDYFYSAICICRQYVFVKVIRNNLNPVTQRISFDSKEDCFSVSIPRIVYTDYIT